MLKVGDVCYIKMSDYTNRTFTLLEYLGGYEMWLVREGENPLYVSPSLLVRLDEENE